MGVAISIGVFPNADVKFFNAFAEERARRRTADASHGMSRDAAAVAVATEMAARDQSDMTRTTSPLMKPLDAIEVETTALSVDETVDLVLEIVNKAMAAPQ